MKSPGGKVEWKCPMDNCGSPDIEREHIPLSWAALYPRDDIRWENDYYCTSNYGHCLKCDSWFPWSHRLKVTTKQKGKEIVVTVTEHSDKHWLYSKEEWETSESCRTPPFAWNRWQPK